MRQVCGTAVLALALVFSNGPAARAQKADQLTVMSHDALEIVKVLTMQERDWNRGDLDAFLSSYKHSPDTTFVGLQVQHGWDQMAAHYRASYPNKDTMGTLSFSELEPRLIDDHIAIMTGRFALERGKKFGGNASGVFSLVFEKTDGGWKIVLDHTS